MTRAEKAALAKQFEAERAETQQVISEARAARVIEHAKPVKTFELDGEQIAYESEPDTTGTSLGSINLAIARRKRDLED